MNRKVEGSTTVEEIAEKYPELIRVLRELGIVCIRCGEPVWGTLAEIVAEKGKDLDRVLDELNQNIR